MIFLNKPYFMTNQDWYRRDEELGRFVLTDKAPPKAVESYKKFYDLLEEMVIEN
jgi:hypothetical protein